MKNPTIRSQEIPAILLLFNIFVAIVYLLWWFLPGNQGNAILYGILFVGEIYHVVIALLFWHTVWPEKKHSIRKDFFFIPHVDVFITVAGEPSSVVSKTVMAALSMHYPNFKVWILNDGYVAKKDNWKEIEQVAKNLRVGCITRKQAGGAKAGNINHALSKTHGQFIAIFDADMSPHNDFLSRTIPYFLDRHIGFVQTPQYYRNQADNFVVGASWEQQEFFFGPIMIGKNKTNAAFICGTNVVIRRKALLDAGGMYEDNIAEDFLTSLFIHEKGWKSFYIPDVLAEGLAPQDLLAYYKQQLRWSRGSLEVLFKFNPIFQKNLTWSQKLEYLSSGLFYLNGFFVAVDIIMPLVFLYTGLQPISAGTTTFATFFLPFMLASLYTLRYVSKGSLTFRALSFSVSSWFLQLQALMSVLFKRKTEFSVTPKQQQKGNFLFLAYPHIIYLVLVVGGIFVALYRQGLTPSVATNVAWGGFNISLFLPYIFASLNFEDLVAFRIRNKFSISQKV